MKCSTDLDLEMYLLLFRDKGKESPVKLLLPVRVPKASNLGSMKAFPDCTLEEGQLGGYSEGFQCHPEPLIHSALWKIFPDGNTEVSRFFPPETAEVPGRTSGSAPSSFSAHLTLRRQRAQRLWNQSLAFCPRRQQVPSVPNARIHETLQLVTQSLSGI